MKVGAVFKFPNGMVVVFDENGAQVPELQGPDTPELRRRLAPLIEPSTELHGYTRLPPAVGGPEVPSRQPWEHWCEHCGRWRSFKGTDCAVCNRPPPGRISNIDSSRH